MQLRTRILVMVCVAAMPLLAVLLFAGADLIETTRRRAFRDIQVRALLAAVAHEHTFTAARRFLTTIANENEICSVSYEVMIAGLEGIRNVAFVRRDGTIACSNPAPHSALTSVEMELLHRAVETRSFVYGASQLSPVDGKMTLRLMHPIIAYDFSNITSQVIGVALAEFDFEWFNQRLDQVPWSHDIRVTVVGSDDTVLFQYPSIAGRVGQKILPATQALIRSSAVGVREAIDPTGVERIMSYIAVPGVTGTVIMASADAEQVLQPVQAAMRQSLFGGIATALLTLFLTLLGTHIVVRKPLRRLTSVIERWSNGDQSARAATARGATEIVKLGQAFNEMADTVAARNAALAQLSAEKAHMMAAVAHDKRHKLQVLQILLDQLKGLPEEQVDGKVLLAAQNSLDDLAHAITQLMSATALETGSMPEPDIYQVSVMHVLETVAMETEVRANAKGVDFTLMPSSLTVLTDPAILTTIVQNFADNAVKYTERGRILIGVKRAGDMARIMVADTGIGVPKEHQTEVFREFHQVTPGQDGIGLGLGIVSRLAPRIGARAHLRSTPGRGSIFMVDVPLVNLPAADVDEHHDQLELSPS